MLKNLSRWAVMSVLVAGLAIFSGCQGDDITAPEQELDASGNPVGTATMVEEDGVETGAGGEAEDAGTEESGTEEAGTEEAGGGN